MIRAGFALHAWQLLTQYKELTKDLQPAERYEATLTVCVLQFLLTNCWELWKFLEQEESCVLEPLNEYTLSMLANPEVEVNNSGRRDCEVKEVLRYVRNALSHPTRMKVTGPPTTGYTTVEDGTGYVARLRFTASPEIDSRGSLTPKGSKRTGGDIQQARVFEIEMPLAVLTAWALKVAEVLAQPTKDNWDSRDLVALSL